MDAHLEELTAGQRAALAAIVAAPLAWTTRRSISRRAHVRAGPLLDRLERGAWVVRWLRAKDGKLLRIECWTLTLWGATRLGVVLDEEVDGEPRWFHVPPKRAIRSTTRVAQLKYPERVVDHRPPPRYVVDLDTGEATEDPAQATTLFGKPLPTWRPRPKRKGTRCDRS